jgi:drug/metabolite transporter (DMT)-like permease
MKIAFLTALTMVAFAANSIFCRLALVDPANDPISFTILRLFSGAVILSLFMFRAKPNLSIKRLSAPLMLFSYALFFSLSYVNIDAGTGALILFASVQLTMMAVSLARGERMSQQETMGAIMALGGFIYLVLPGVNTPPLMAAGLMMASGISWGVYSLLGKGNKNPIAATAQNFVFTLPVIGVLFFIFPFQMSESGMMWAVLSGALTSGMGYVLWYVVLRDLATSTAAVVQLSVPAIAAFAGVIFLGESVHSRLLTASALIIGGIYLKVKKT